MRTLFCSLAWVNHGKREIPQAGPHYWAFHCKIPRGETFRRNCLRLKGINSRPTLMLRPNCSSQSRSFKFVRISTLNDLKEGWKSLKMSHNCRLIRMTESRISWLKMRHVISWYNFSQTVTHSRSLCEGNLCAFLGEPCATASILWVTVHLC